MLSVKVVMAFEGGRDYKDVGYLISVRDHTIKRYFQSSRRIVGVNKLKRKNLMNVQSDATESLLLFFSHLCMRWNELG